MAWLAYWNPVRILLSCLQDIGFKTENADFVHVDFVAKVTEKTGGTTTQSWMINPGSHDSTIGVPESGFARTNRCWYANYDRRSARQKEFVGPFSNCYNR